MVALFISDLHLSTKTTHLNELFFQFLARYAAQAKALTILGDLFEVWLGEDHEIRFHQTIAEALKSIAARGVSVTLMPGNRDFLMSDAFVEAAAARRLLDPSLIELHGRPMLLSHGDLLCTQDKLYQWYRLSVHNRLFQSLFLRLPLKMRHWLSSCLQRPAADQKPTRDALSANLRWDVVRAAVEAWMRRYGCRQLIHGHTHQPGIHCFRLNEQWAKRITLSDWQHQPNALICQPDGKMMLEYFST